jgi:CDP-4-dehydro-6-deoxyglucose reductase
VIEAIEASGSHEMPQQQITARVRDLRFVNDDIALLHLKTPRANRLRFLAGQRVRLGGNDMPAAVHPVGSCPCDDMNLHFQIARIAGDAFSGHVFNRLKKGDQVDINGPTGDFVLNESSTRPAVFIAWQTGFAPIRSLLEHAISLDTAAAMYLLWYAPASAGHYMDNLCRSWRDALDNFHYVPVNTGRLDGPECDPESIATLLNIRQGNLAGHDFYIAAGSSMQATWIKMLTGAGVPANQISCYEGANARGGETETL